MTDHRAALTYSSYLGLDDILGAQRPRTEEHDELLFIVIHQVYELWFKQLLHEGAHLQGRLEDGDTPHALHTLKRMLTILKTVVAQIDVLETMTPRQFLTFRDRLEAASGFQSAQFRELEAFLGRRDSRALAAYDPASDEHARIAAAMARPVALRLRSCATLVRARLLVRPGALPATSPSPSSPPRTSSERSSPPTPTTASPPRSASA
jgi:Tryptophan 2,3-dioxygenase (vermilion)